MTWNYRLVKAADGTYGIHSVYYDESGYPNGMSMTPVVLGPFDYDAEDEDAIESMQWELDKLQQALTKEIFEEPSYWNDGEDT